jgi:cation:H+ antiporter
MLLFDLFHVDVGINIVGFISFFILVFASWCVGEGGEILGKKYDASIIGGLLIAWLNTTPEAIFFITALYSGNPRFAVGAVSGSSIVVCTIALGICLILGALARKNQTIQLQSAVKRQCAILGFSLLITMFLILTGFSIVSGILGVGYYIWFLYFSLTHKEVTGQREEEKMMDDLESQHEEENEEDVDVRKGIMYLCLGGFLIMMFSSPFIDSVVNAASYLQVNPILLAFFLAPIASEAPEILESISLSRKGNSQNINIAYSNLIGGTITKTSLLCGIFSFFGVAKEFKWESPHYTLSLSLLIVCAAAAAGIGFFAQYQTKWHGVGLIFIFMVTGIIQFIVNTHLGMELFLDEGFGHDDQHHLQPNQEAH